MSVRLIPPSTELTQPYWDGARQEQLVMQQCADCAETIFPPRANCPKCGSAALSWRTLSGKGVIYTYTVAHRAPHPVLNGQTPIVIAVVESEEGPRMISNVTGCDPSDVEVGMSVQVAFEEIDDSDVVLPVFKPA